MHVAAATTMPSGVVPPPSRTVTEIWPASGSNRAFHAPGHIAVRDGSTLNVTRIESPCSIFPAPAAPPPFASCTTVAP